MEVIAPSSPSRPAIDLVLQVALQEFNSILTDEQRNELHRAGPVPDADSVLVFTAQLDDINRKGRSVATRLHTVLLSVQNFCSVVDTFVSSHPEIAALVWGSVKITMQIIVNYTSYYEAISDMFMKLGKLCPLFAEYHILYPSSKGLQRSLIDFHASIIRCCKHIVQAIKRPWHDQVLRAFWNSFEREFKPDIDAIQRYSHYVQGEITLAKAQVDRQDQQLQAREREKASQSRRGLKSFFSQNNIQLAEIRDWELQRYERQRRKRRQQLLDNLSTFNHMRLLKQNQRKRYSSTARWIFQTPEFQRWKNTSGSSLLWCSVGSGKTVMTSSVVDHILLEKGHAECHLSFFFVQSDDQESLNATTMLRSMLRQRLDPTTMPDDIEQELQLLSLSDELDTTVALFGRVIGLKTSYIIIDGLDECNKSERETILRALATLAFSGLNMKIFISSRDGLAEEIRKRFDSIDHISMNNPLTDNDITTYVNGVIEEKITTQDLRVGDSSLVEEIKQTLVQRADGMFLWVYFQIFELCSQHCDEDIRNSLKDLPKDLAGTFCRALRRIVSRGHKKESQNIFPWIAASKQLLSLGGLREAISVEVGQPYLKRERLYNDMEDIATWCENLVQIDEEEETFQFAHYTIREFLLEEPVDSRLAEFHVDIDDADHMIGEICVTYLNINEFKTTLTRQPKSLPLPSPVRIVEATLGLQSKITDMVRARLGPKDISETVYFQPTLTSGRGYSNSPTEALESQYPFLNYASTNWIEHTRNFSERRSKTWNMWKDTIFTDHELVVPPWKTDTMELESTTILRWAHETRHYAVIHAIDWSMTIPSDMRTRMIFDATKDNDMTLLDILLFGSKYTGKIDSLQGQAVLQAAARSGHLQIVERLIEAGTDVNMPAAPQEGKTALQAASENGHLEIIRALLTAGANVNAAAAESKGLTALQGAAKSGNLRIVKLLIESGAEINNAGARFYGRTALQAAAEHGHLKTVDMLIAAGADVNSSTTSVHRLTAMQAATQNGHFDICNRLLEAGAITSVNTENLLREAAKQGHVELVKKLLGHINHHICAAALCLMAKGGHALAVCTLLEAGVDMNITLSNNQTALYEAADHGRAEIVQIMVDVGADLHVLGGQGTALNIAKYRGHQEVVEILEEAAIKRPLKRAAEISRKMLEV